MATDSGIGTVSIARSRNMRAVRSKDTAAERLVRSILHKCGYRFRLHDRSLPGKPDIVFGARRRVVEVRGCFWHLHADPQCPKAGLPQTRREWWAAKLNSNAARDERNVSSLREAGWEVLEIWECQLKDPASLRKRLVDYLGPPRFERPGLDRPRASPGCHRGSLPVTTASRRSWGGRKGGEA